MLAEEFISANLHRIFLQVLRRVGNVDDAQELTQEVFIKALQNAEHLRQPQKAAHWLSRIATNTALDFLRRNHGRECNLELDALAQFPDLRQPTPEEAALRKERHKYFHERLKRLSLRERTALILRDVEAMPAAEVARLMGCSQATVRSHVANARIKLKQMHQGKAPRLPSEYLERPTGSGSGPGIQWPAPAHQ